MNHMEKLLENILIILLIMKTVLIFHIIRLCHIQTIQPYLFRVN